MSDVRCLIFDMSSKNLISQITHGTSYIFDLKLQQWQKTKNTDFQETNSKWDITFCPLLSPFYLLSSTF